MRIKNISYVKILRLFLSAYIAYYFALTILPSYSQGFILLGIVFFLILFTTRTEYTIYFILATRTLLDIGYLVAAGNVRLTHIIAASLVFLFLLYVFIIRRFNIFSLDINKIYFAFLICGIPSIVYRIGEGTLYYAGYWFRFLQGFVMLNLTVLMVLDHETEPYEKKVNKICWSVILAVLIPYALYVYNFMHGVYRVGTGGLERYSAFGAHSNIFSYIVFIVFAFVFYFYSITPRKSSKNLWFILLGVMAFTMYINYTRAVWFGLVAMVISWNILRRNVISTLLTLGIVICMVAFIPVIQERLSDLIILLTSDNFFDLDPGLGAGRVGILQANLKYFINEATFIEKLFGCGYDLRLATSRGGNPMPEHNNYLLLLMNTGIIGLLMYMIYIIKLFKESFRLLRNTRKAHLRNLAQVFISVLYGYLAISFFDHMLWNITYQYYFSVLAGFIIAANIVEERKNKSEAILSEEVK